MYALNHSGGYSTPGCNSIICQMASPFLLELNQITSHKSTFWERPRRLESPGALHATNSKTYIFRLENWNIFPLTLDIFKSVWVCSYINYFFIVYPYHLYLRGYTVRQKQMEASNNNTALKESNPTHVNSLR